jgi:S-adenosylmethionine:tRNA ribosyltransferase-isomerase
MFSRSAYQFDLPQDLIAETPIEQREQSRLLSVTGQQVHYQLEHLKILDLIDRIPAGTVIVANNSKVFAARLLGNRIKQGTQGGGAVEFFLLKPVGPKRWQGLMKSGAKIQIGFQFEIKGVRAEVVAREDTNSGALFTAVFEVDPVEHELGVVPLPPYIQRAPGANELNTYNTQFASEVGSVAAPTAGRHFTMALIEALKARGVEWCEITLHVGIGTFKPVGVEDVREHTMHPEVGMISEEVARTINQAKKEGRQVLAVGTTSTRTLEGFWDANAQALQSGQRSLDLFIYPGSGHRWSVVDQMITNFHLPESTLLMMICDFYGDVEGMLKIYREAIQNRYRFYSYGDAMWLRR